MAHLFYDHLVEWKKLDDVLLSLELDKEERMTLLELAEESIHTEVLILIFEELPREHHEEFLLAFHAAPHDVMHVMYLRGKGIDDIEHRIHLRALEIIEDLIESITLRSQ